MIKELLSGEIECKLAEVSFEMLPELSSGTTVSIMYRDRTAFAVEEDGLKIRCFRDVKLEPEGEWSLTVGYQAKHKYKDSKAFELLSQMPHEQLLEALNEDIQYYVHDQYDRLAMVICEITGAFGAPAITPPELKLPETD